ncbi:acyltransferase family protein [Fictibacillus iocasae]|uniref:Acyltransferase family protein n=1 Tax=Fictibacillus iocasae TaxID=2715437 RepID=A0ABW2NZT9_9BACL
MKDKRARKMVSLQSTAEKPRYITGLDGIRAIAVLAVIAYHLNFQWASGGLLGVTVFFVLSGYLITDLLISEYNNNGTIDLKRFWIRRARRLLPGMFTMLLVVMSFVTLFRPSLLTKLWEDSLAAIFYISNWYYVFQELSYFESFGITSLLTHFWSLAVEEQFYIIWPLFIGLLLKLPKRLVFLYTVMLATISALAMAALYEPGADPSRIYYGTDTRAFSLLIGAALAMIWPSRKLSQHTPLSARLSMDVIGTAALAVILYMIWQTNQYQDFLYQGGMVILSIASAVLVGAVAHPSSTLNKVLSLQPLKWIGLRSYGIYLWHFPVIALSTPTVNVGGIEPVRIIFQVTLILFLSALSYTFVEMPIRNGAITRTWDMMRRGEWRGKLGVYTKFVTVSGIILMLCVISTLGVVSDRIVKASDPMTLPLIGTIEDKEVPAMKPSEPEKPEKPVQEIKPEPPREKERPEERAPSSTPPPPPKPEKPVNKDAKITMVGDSVMIAAKPYLEVEYPHLKADGKVGRQMEEAYAIFNQLKSSGQLHPYVVVELGTNGPFDKEQLDEVLDLIGEDKEILLVNVRVPRPWQTVVNDVLSESAAERDNVTLVDWYNASAAHAEYFAGDGVHLTQTGAKAYSALITEELINVTN